MSGNGDSGRSTPAPVVDPNIQRAIEAGFWDVLGERMISDSRAHDIRVRRALEGALDGPPFDASRLSSLDGASELTVVAIRAVDPGG